MQPLRSSFVAKLLLFPLIKYSINPKEMIFTINFWVITAYNGGHPVDTSLVSCQYYWDCIKIGACLILNAVHLKFDWICLYNFHYQIFKIPTHMIYKRRRCQSSWLSIVFISLKYKNYKKKQWFFFQISM